jgi:sugar lactone lactonase YvrE
MGTRFRSELWVCALALCACAESLPPAAAANPSPQPSAAGPTTPAARPSQLEQRPSGFEAPEVLIAASSFHGVHGLAIDARGRLLAGVVVGGEMWEVDRNSGSAHVLIGEPDGEADDIAVGPQGELAWTSFEQGIVRIRDSDVAPIRQIAKGLPGINSIAFDKQTGKLYASQVFLGDALWEIDRTGKAAPRLIAKDLGGFNGFEVGPDSRLYGPLWFKGQVVKINPSNGSLVAINREFKVPAAANLDGKGNLWVVDTALGVLSKVELKSGKKTDVKTLATGLDNLAIAPEGTIYVSNMDDNAIVAIDPNSGDVKTLTSGKLAAPAGLKLDGDHLYVADVFSFRAVDINSGAVRDVYRMHAASSELAYPSSVGLGSKLIALSSADTNTVQLLDRATQKSLEVVRGFKVPADAIPLDDGSLLVAEVASNSLLRASGEHYQDRKVVAQDLGGPTQMILGKDGAVYLTESVGRLTRIDLASGAKTIVANNLQMPEGLAQTPWGTFIVAESQAQRLVEIDPKDGSLRVVAEKLPIGLSPKRPDTPGAYLPTGVAVSGDGTVFVSADLDNSLLRIRAKE